MIEPRKVDHCGEPTYFILRKAADLASQTGEKLGRHRGLRAGHEVKRVTWELGRASRLLVEQVAVYLREENTGPDRERTRPVKEPVPSKKKRGGGKTNKRANKVSVAERKAQDTEKDGRQS